MVLEKLYPHGHIAFFALPRLYQSSKRMHAPYMSSVEKFTNMSGAVITMEWFYSSSYMRTLDVVEGHMFKFLLVFIFQKYEDFRWLV
jgi:hypothetical protein